MNAVSAQQPAQQPIQASASPDILTLPPPPVALFPAPSSPQPPRHIRRPWEKAANKIRKKTGHALPYLLLPLLAKMEIKDRNLGGYGLLPRIAFRECGLGPDALRELMRLKVIGICVDQSKRVAPVVKGKEAEPPPLKIKLHPYIARALAPYFDQVDAVVQWAKQTVQRNVPHASENTTTA